MGRKNVYEAFFLLLFSLDGINFIGLSCVCVCADVRLETLPPYDPTGQQSSVFLGTVQLVTKLHFYMQIVSCIT